MVRDVSLHSMRVSDCLDVLPWFLLFHLFASLSSPLQSSRLEKHFGVSFVPIHSVIGKVLPEVDGQVGHGLRLVL